MKMVRFVVLAVTLLVLAINASAQNTTTSQPSGFFPDAEFTASFLKYTRPTNVYSPFFSWEGKMGIDMTIYRLKKHQLNFKSEFQTVGAKNLGSKINISGTSYILEFRYGYSFSERTMLSFGMTHLSNHFATDFANVARDERRRGNTVPSVDTSDLNVFFGELHKRFAGRFEPELKLRIQPVGFRFRGNTSKYENPVHLTVQAVPWSGHEKRVVVATQKEFGKHGYSEFSLRLELAAKNQREGRFQPFIAYSPGKDLHVSPTEGWHRGGLKLGMKFIFKVN